MRIATLDLISNTCFPLLAADELGLFEAEGLDVSIELNSRGVQALRSGACDLLANGSLFGLLKEFPGWKGAKLVVALAGNTMAACCTRRPCRQAGRPERNKGSATARR